MESLPEEAAPAATSTSRSTPLLQTHTHPNPHAHTHTHIPEPDTETETETESQTKTQTPPQETTLGDAGHSSPSPPHSPKSRPVSGVIPPYWQRHTRHASRASQSSLRNQQITLEDHTADPESETSRGLWAQSVSIEDHVVVQGKTGVGAYVVWNCRVQTLDGGPMVVRMRYSEFDELRKQLVSSFPHAKSALPALPPKSVLYKFRPNFLENRRVGLEYFFNCVLLNPEFSSSPVVKDFLFGRLS